MPSYSEQGACKLLQDAGELSRCVKLRFQRSSLQNKVSQLQEGVRQCVDLIRAQQRTHQHCCRGFSILFDLSCDADVPEAEQDRDLEVSFRKGTLIAIAGINVRTQSRVRPRGFEMSIKNLTVSLLR
jgi:hypothetical protein